MTDPCTTYDVSLRREGLNVFKVDAAGIFGAAQIRPQVLVAIDERPASFFVNLWRESGEDWADIIPEWLAEIRDDPEGPIRVEYVNGGVLQVAHLAPRYRDVVGERTFFFGAEVASAVVEVTINQVVSCGPVEAAEAQEARNRQHDRTLLKTRIGAAALVIGGIGLGYALGRRSSRPMLEE